LVEEYKEKLGKLGADQGGKLWKALKAAAVALDRRVRLPLRGEEGSVSFYLIKARRGKAKGEVPPPRRRGQPRKRQ
jgi:hypothetical protein